MSRPSPRTTAPPITIGYKRPAEGQHKAFCFGFFAFCFLMWEVLEGKGIAEQGK
jgi:hypothetical protein